MPFIGRQPLVGNYIKLDAITTSATTTFNLTAGGVAVYPQTATNCIVSLNGIIQAPTDAYTISGSTIVFASALTASDVIDFITVLGDVLNIGTPSDGTISTAKLATGLVVPYGKGGTGLTTLGTANQVLATNSGATAIEWQSVSSDYVLLATTTASGSATSVSFDGYFSSTYDNYILMCYNIYSSTTSSTDHTLRAYLRRSNANVTASSYLMYRTAGRAYSGASDTGNQGGSYGESQIRFNENTQTESSAGANSYNLTIHLFDPLGTTNYKYGLFNYVTHSATNAQFHSSLGGFALKDNTNALSGINIYVNAGNIYGKFKLYGIK